MEELFNTTNIFAAVQKPAGKQPDKRAEEGKESKKYVATQ